VLVSRKLSCTLLSLFIGNCLISKESICLEDLHLGLAPKQHVIDVKALEKKIEELKIVGTKNGHIYKISNIHPIKDDIFPHEGFSFEVIDSTTGEKVGKGNRMYNAITNTYESGSSYFEGALSQGIGRRIHQFFYDEALPGTKIRFLSDEARTEAMIHKWVEEFSGDGPYMSISYKSREKGDEYMEKLLNQKMASLLAQNKTRELPFWAGVLAEVGWKNVHLEYSRDKGTWIVGEKK